MDFDPLGPGGGHQVRHHLGIEGSQGTRSHFQNHDPLRRAQARGKVGKLEGDEPSPHENDPGRQLIELQKIAAGDQVFGPREGQRHGMGPGGQNEILPLHRIPVYGNGVRSCENGRAGDKIDAGPLQALAGGGGNRIGESALLPADGRPVHFRRLDYALAFQVPGPGHEFGGFIVPFLGLTAGQSANAAGRRAVLHNGHGQPVFHQRVGGRLPA